MLSSDSPSEENPYAPPSTPDVVSTAVTPVAAESEDRNFVVMALYQIMMRTGWVFKTESIVMPVVLDVITGGGAVGATLRGCLPMLNRLGHSIPPLLFSRRLKLLPQKRWAIFGFTLAMSLIMFTWAALFYFASTTNPLLLSGVFLVLYVMFFAVTGINNLSFGTLQGKLIQPTRRGRLMLAANTIGVASAITAVALLLPHWLTPTDGKFHLIFGFGGLLFLLSAGCMLLPREPADNHVEPNRGVQHLFRAAAGVLRRDANFRRLVLVGMAFGASLALFPHYQALARQRLSLQLDNIMWWLIVQNFGTAMFSLVAGPLADFRGNRLVMRLLLIGVMLMPLGAIALSYCPTWGPILFPGIFMFVGLTPVGFKVLTNYTLEISPTSEHPRYLSTLSLCIAAPLLLSPGVGWLVAMTSFEVVFFAISGVVFVGWLLTYWLREPRHHLHSPSPVPVVPEQP